MNSHEDFMKAVQQVKDCLNIRQAKKANDTDRRRITIAITDALLQQGLLLSKHGPFSDYAFEAALFHALQGETLICDTLPYEDYLREKKIRDVNPLHLVSGDNYEPSEKWDGIAKAIITTLKEERINDARSTERKLFVKSDIGKGPARTAENIPGNTGRTQNKRPALYKLERNTESILRRGHSKILSDTILQQG